MIQAIELYKLRNAEYLQFTTDVLRIVNINNPTALQIQAKYDALNLFKNDLETLFKKSTTNPITTEIENLDKRRDNAVSGILAVINGNSYHFDNAISNQAKTLLDYLKIYSGNIVQENYNAETATINNMISDFETKPELTAAMTALNLTAWKNELKAANTDFSTQYIARTIDLATASPDNLKSKRIESNNAFYELRNHIDAFATISPSVAYTKTINEINVLITQYNALLVGRTVLPTTLV